MLYPLDMVLSNTSVKPMHTMLMPARAVSLRRYTTVVDSCNKDNSNETLPILVLGYD
jgi:hypothetical protein